MAQIDIELAKLKETKANIAQSITAKGGVLDNPSEFSTYSMAIDNLPSTGGGGGLDFSSIGYTTTPEPLNSGMEYAKLIMDNWDSSITSCFIKYLHDKLLYFFPIVNVDNVNNMNSMFEDSNLLIAPNLHTPNLTSAKYLFESCSALLYADLSNWTLSNVPSMNSMFNSCKNIKTIIFPKGLRPTDAGNMFWNCGSLTLVNLEDIDFSQCTSMLRAFDSCSSLTVIPNLETGNCTNLNLIFSNTKSLVRVEGIDMASVTSSDSNLFGTMYSNNAYLRYLKIKNFGNSNLPTSFTYFNKFMSWGADDAANPDAKQSLIDTFITYSIDRSSNPMTVTLPASVLARFTEDEIQLAANKGYILYS